MSQTEEILLPALLKRSARLIDAGIDQTLKQHGIARSQYRVLYYVARYGEPTQTDLMEVMKVQASTLTLIVNALVRKGWLTRTRAVQDKRINKLQLTSDGQKFFQQIPDPARKLHRTIIKSLGQGEAQSLETLLTKIIGELS